MINFAVILKQDEMNMKVLFKFNNLIPLVTFTKQLQLIEGGNFFTAFLSNLVLS